MLFYKSQHHIFSDSYFNKNTIIGTINVLQTIAMQLDLTDEIISNKIVIMKRDLFIVQNTQRSIFRLQDKLDIFDK